MDTDKNWAVRNQHWACRQEIGTKDGWHLAILWIRTEGNKLLPEASLLMNLERRLVPSLSISLLWFIR